MNLPKQRTATYSASHCRLFYFRILTENNVGSAFDGKYVLFCFSVTIFSIAVLWGLTEKFMKNEEQKGAFIQGSYRSSAAILGLAFINNMYDSVGMAPLMIIGCVPLYNIFAVIILTLKGDNGGKKPNMKETFINVMKNPILLSILIGTSIRFIEPALSILCQ